jgi:flagellar hook-length control protein FliK
MMTTNTHVRAGAASGAGAAAQVGAAAGGAGPARNGDFLATLAAALSVEVATSTRGDGTVADLTADTAADSAESIAAIIAALSPIVPMPAEALADAGSREELAASSSGTTLPGTGARDAMAPSTQLADLLRESAGQATVGDAGDSAGDDAGGRPASRELPGQLLQALGGAVREVAPEFRLAGGGEGMTTSVAHAMASAASQLNGSSAAAAADHVLRSAVGSPRWAEELGSRLVLMSTRGNQEGSLTLSPEHLGPLEVRISLNQNTAQVWFGAQHADTRAALAEALPRLREMFAEAGLSLGHAGVSQEAPRRQVQETSTPPAGNAIDPAAEVPALPGVETRSIGSALLDLYA